MSPEERIIQQCWKVALRENGASISLFQRRLTIGFDAARTAIQALENRGLITKADELNQARRLRISSVTRESILGRELQER